VLCVCVCVCVCGKPVGGRAGMRACRASSGSRERGGGGRDGRAWVVDLGSCRSGNDGVIWQASRLGRSLK